VSTQRNYITNLEKSFEMLALVHGRQDTACAGHHALAVHNLAVRGGRWARHRDPLGGGQAGGSWGLKNKKVKHGTR
jgi:hypothetical protein